MDCMFAEAEAAAAAEGQVTQCNQSCGSCVKKEVSAICCVRWRADLTTGRQGSMGRFGRHSATRKNWSNNGPRMHERLRSQHSPVHRGSIQWLRLLTQSDITHLRKLDTGWYARYVCPLADARLSS